MKYVVGHIINQAVPAIALTNFNVSLGYENIGAGHVKVIKRQYHEWRKSNPFLIRLKLPNFSYFCCCLV